MKLFTVKGKRKVVWIFLALLKGVLFFSLYIMLWNSNAKEEICLRRYRFLVLTGIYWLLAAAILTWEIWMPIIRKKLNIRIRRGLWILLWAVFPALSYFTTELACNEGWTTVAWNYIVYNYLIYLICSVTFALVLNRVRAALTLIEIISLIYGTASHYVLKFKGTALRPSELLGARTGLAVAGSYSYALTNNLVKAMLLCMLAYILIAFAAGENPYRKARKETLQKRLIRRFCMLAGGVVLFYGAFFGANASEISGLIVSDWAPIGTYRAAGSALCFLIDSQNLQIKKPKNYSAEKAEELLASYETETKEELDQTVLSNVIVVMNESFADPSVIGAFESEDYLTNYDSIMDYMMKGYAYVSVRGGGTCNSEFEFLTGSTMALFGSDSAPYQTMQFDGFTSMAGIFENLGYKTLAMHPSLASNWNRANVYSQMGFDMFISGENGFEDATSLNNYWIDDESDYKELIRQLEAAEEPVFLFNVTVQNHGGYTTAALEGKDLVEIEEAYQGYDDVIAYLTDIKYSDMALGALIEYFRNSDEPVIFCFFGDHQASLDIDFLDTIEAGNSDAAGSTELEQLQNRYKVPYLIWSNYLEPEQTEMDLSLNYLGAWLLKYAGVQTAYSEYLLDLQETIQVVNKNGYMENDVWISLEEADESLNNYAIVQYYHLFDN